MPDSLSDSSGQNETRYVNLEGLAMVKVFLVDDHEVVRRGLIDLPGAAPCPRPRKDGRSDRSTAKVPALPASA